MKKYLFISSILLTIITIFILININIFKNIKNNKNILDYLNNLFSNQTIEISEYLTIPNLEIDNIDYIGTIQIPNHNISLPIKSKCNNSYINIESACNYSNDSLIILGTNLKDSFSSYKLFDTSEEIIFTNMLSEKFQYKISNIKRISNLNELSFYNEELMIVIKDYYSIEYILFICNSY